MKVREILAVASFANSQDHNGKEGARASGRGALLVFAYRCLMLLRRCAVFLQGCLIQTNLNTQTKLPLNGFQRS